MAAISGGGSPGDPWRTAGAHRPSIVAICRGEGGFDPRFGFSRANARFELRAKVLRAELSERMQDYLRVLDGGAGLFGASGHVSRGEWHDYIRALSRKRRA
ncbi:hypothetical protein, partial [Zoogloea ramigera]|uniref:hypothetical protein n=1 Tax=Zoogloea ramigera TaxID=350 RepID=UPI001C3FECDB